MPPNLIQEEVNKYLPFVLEFRRRLLFAISLFIIASIVGFIYYEEIIVIILNFFNLKGVNIVFTTPFQFFTLALNSGLIVGVIFIIPVLIHQLLDFLKPALQPKEYKVVVSILPLAFVLFFLGFAYGIIMMKYVLQIGNMIDVENFLSKVLSTGLLMGIAFLFPIVMTILMQLKLVRHLVFENQRPVAYLIAMVFVIFLPPPDLLSDVILVAPLLILFELTLILNRVFLKTHLL